MTESTSFHQRGLGRRTGRDRRAAADRRQAERRRRTLSVSENRRTGQDRRAGARRSGQTRRSALDRRQPRFAVAPGGVIGSMARPPRPRPTPDADGITDRDRARARRLPEDLLAANGSAVERLNKVIRHSWPRHPLPIRAAMAEQLLPVVRPLIQSGVTSVTPEIRKACEEAAVRGLRHKAH